MKIQKTYSRLYVFDHFSSEFGSLEMGPEAASKEIRQLWPVFRASDEIVQLDARLLLEGMGPPWETNATFQIMIEDLRARHVRFDVYPTWRIAR